MFFEQRFGGLTGLAWSNRIRALKGLGSLRHRVRALAHPLWDGLKFGRQDAKLTAGLAILTVI